MRSRSVRPRATPKAALHGEGRDPLDGCTPEQRARIEAEVADLDAEGPHFAQVVTAERYLLECEAKRRIIEHHHVECGGHPGAWMPHGDYGPGYCSREDEGNSTLLYLALPYAEHPDYREEWRP